MLVCSEEISIANPGRQSYRYRVTWKGDTVVAIIPRAHPSEGCSRLTGRPVRLSVDADEPGPLDRRRWLRQTNAQPEPVALQVDDGAIQLS